MKKIKNKKIRFAKVPEVTERADAIEVPLCPVGDTHFSATIAYDLYRLGIPLKTIKFYNECARKNPLKKIEEYIKAYGRKIYDVIGNGFKFTKTEEV